MKRKACLALVPLLLVAAWFMFGTGARGRPEWTSPTPVGSEESKPSSELAGVAEPRAPEREAVDQGDSQRTAASHAADFPILEESTPTEAPRKYSCRVHAVVVDDAGRPIEGAELLLTYPPESIGFTDRDGVFDAVFEWPRERGETLWDSVHALADGYTVGSTSLDTRDGGVVDLGVLTLVPGGEARGHVRTEAGVGLPNITLGVAPARLSSDRGEDDPDVIASQPWPETVAVSGPGGAFRLRGIPEGTWSLVSYVGGDEFRGAAFPLQAGDILRDRDLIVVPPGPVPSMRGTVLDPNGEPVPDAIVRLALDGVGFFPRSRTDPDGKFEFEDLSGYEEVSEYQDPNHPFSLLVTDATLRWESIRLDEVVPDGVPMELRFARGLPLLVSLVDQEGEPVPWAHMQVVVEASSRNWRSELLSLGRQGTLRVARPRGSFTLRTFAPGFRDADFGPFDPKTVRAALELAVQPGQAIRGRVVFEGRPVIGARIRLGYALSPPLVQTSMGVAPLPTPFHLLGSDKKRGYDATTDSDGQFVAGLHDDLRKIIAVEADGFPKNIFGPMDVDRELGLAGLELELERGGSLVGRVLLPLDRDGERPWIGVSNGWGEAHTQRVDESGGFRFEDLVPGGWEIREVLPPVATVQALGGAHPREIHFDWDFQVASNQTTRFDLDLTRTRSVLLEGRLRLGKLDASGWRAFLAKDGVGVEMADLAPDGRFEVGLPEGGHFTLSLQGGAMGLALAEEIDLVEGSNSWDLELSFGSAEFDARNIDEPDSLKVVTHVGERGVEVTSPFYRHPTEEEGRYSFPMVPAGQAEVVFRIGAERKSLLQFEVVAGETVTLELWE